jgi:hypothetical protein
MPFLKDRNLFTREQFARKFSFLARRGTKKLMFKPEHGIKDPMAGLLMQQGQSRTAPAPLAGKLAENLRVVGVGGHTLQAVGEDFDGGADVLVLVEGRDPVLSTLHHQVVGGRLDCRVAGELRSGSAGFRRERRFIKALFLVLEFPALLVEGFKSCRVEIDVGDGCEKTFQNEPVNSLLVAFS